jgi:hypothetical protein
MLLRLNCETINGIISKYITTNIIINTIIIMVELNIREKLQYYELSVSSHLLTPNTPKLKLFNNILPKLDMPLGDFFIYNIYI